MKRLLPVFALFNVLLMNAQSKSVQLQWSDQNYLVSSGESFFVPGFQPELYKYNSGSRSIQGSVIVPNVNGDKVRIVSHKLQPIDLAKYKNLDVKNIPSEIKTDISVYSTKGIRSAVITFTPIVKSGSGYSKVTDISFEVYGTAAAKAQFKNITVSNSVLSQGKWTKFKINETGVYRMDRNFLKSLGLPDDVDPRTVKVYGYGGAMLPLANRDNAYFDLPELAIQFKGEEDGTLNDGDHVLFYGVGTKGWSNENLTHLNLYSNDAYYYITYGGTYGKRMPAYTEPAGQSTETYTDYKSRVFHEQNLTNLVQLSRKWFGENFNNNAQQSINVTLQTPMLNSSKPALVGIGVGAISSNATVFNYVLNSQQFGSQTLPGKNSSALAWEGYFEKEQNLNSETQNLQINFSNNGVPSAQGFIDFVAVDYYKHLAGYNKQFKFGFEDAVSNVGTGAFRINNATSITQVWDVSDKYNPSFKTNTASVFNLKFPYGTLKEFIAVDQNDLYVPELLPNSNVLNQNLKGTILKDGNVDYLIITREDEGNNLRSAAENLANLHRSKNNFKVKVVSLQAIYNEFSGGQQDVVAIRNFIRYVYEAGNKTLKYVNLFGDASMDYLYRKDKGYADNNQVPIYHLLGPGGQTTSFFNFDDQNNFSTDDFYALLDEDDDVIRNSSYLGLDVAVGRMPVNTIQEANAMVKKIEEYLDKDNAGRWKNTYTALADDVDGISDATLQVALNQMVDELVQNKPYFNVKKVFADSYQQQVVAGGPRYPKAKEDFLNGINSGSLLVNYLGHGNETGLGDERYFDLVDIDQLNNKGKYPLFTIITCEFTRFENPYLQSGGERLYLRENAGAIGILATTRKIGIGNANVFTNRISKWLFDYNNNLPDVTIGEALMLTKNDTEQPVAEKGVVAFIGDPALKLAIAKPDIVITQINDTPIENFTGSLRALDRIKLKGQVTTEGGQLISNFNGNLAVQLFDKNQEKTTLVNDGVGDPMTFTALGETVFRGNASVLNGVFEIEFVVPKDIKIAVGEGKASFYAVKESAVLDDYTGANTAIKIGGVNENAAEDNKAPQIKLFMNDETFISGGITNNSPLFLAHLEDENGMNTASGIGHDMVAVLDGDENNPFVMNEFYETEPNNFQKGFVNYPFSNLKEGLHTITFKAWDVYNNLATATLDFVVTASSGLQLDKVLNYPNPFVDYTEFWFQHNRPNETLQVQVQILTVSGKIVKTINQTVVSDGFLSKDIKWDGRDDFGDRIGKGVYIYRLKVKATGSGEQAEKIEKLVIL